MFQESLIESLPSAAPRSRWPALVSIAVQAVLVAGLLIIPILHPEVFPLAANHLIVLPPPMLRPVPPPPPQHPVPVLTTTTAPSLAPATQAPQLPRPSLITDAPTVDQPILAVGISGTPNGSPIADLTSGVPAAPHIVVASPASNATATRGPLNISSGVIAGLLLAPIRPVYPPIARIAHAEGSVIIQAIISRDGHIESAHVVSGPPLLQAAALEAVRQARYRPFLLNNQPTEVETTITINFRLGSE